MPKKKAGTTRGRRMSTSSSPQLQICSVLLQNDLSREDLAAALPGLTASQISSALNNAKSHKRVKFNDAEQVYTLTKAGREWAEASGAEATQAAPEKPARKSVAHRRGRRPHQAAPAAVDTSPTTAPMRTFRCAVFSDGGFFLAKGDQRIELDAAEHAEMLAYLERMAEEA